MNCLQLELPISFGKSPENKDIVLTVLPDTLIYKTEWKYGSDKILLKINSESSSEEVELEMEYWMDQIRSYSPPAEHKEGIMSAIRWMSTLLC